MNLILHYFFHFQCCITDKDTCDCLCLEVRLRGSHRDTKESVDSGKSRPLPNVTHHPVAYHHHPSHSQLSTITAGTVEHAPVLNQGNTVPANKHFNFRSVQSPYIFHSQSSPECAATSTPMKHHQRGPRIRHGHRSLPKLDRSKQSRSETSALRSTPGQSPTKRHTLGKLPPRSPVPLSQSLQLEDSPNAFILSPPYSTT